MTKTDVLSRCLTWQRGLPYPIVENGRVLVCHLPPEELADGEGIGWVVSCAHLRDDGSIDTIAEQPLLLVPAGYEDVRRLETYLEAVSRALVRLMNGTGTLWFHCCDALSSTAVTEEELVDEILRLNEPMW